MNLQSLWTFLSVQNIFSDCPQLVKKSTSFRIGLNEVTKLVDFTESSKSSEYLSMNFQTFQNFLKVLSMFIEFLLAITCPQSFWIYFHEFSNSPGLPEGPKYFSRISISHKMSPKLLNIFLWIFKQSRTSWRS